MTTITDLLNEWGRLADAAQAGPWVVHHFGHSTRVGIDYSSSPTDITGSINATGPEETAAFIAASRTAIPALLSAVEKVLALHTPTYPLDGPDRACFHCAVPATTGKFSWVEWPCPTVAALAEALGVPDGA